MDPFLPENELKEEAPLVTILKDRSQAKHAFLSWHITVVSGIRLSDTRLRIKSIPWREKMASSFSAPGEGRDPSIPSMDSFLEQAQPQWALDADTARCVNKLLCEGALRTKSIIKLDSEDLARAMSRSIGPTYCQLKQWVRAFGWRAETRGYGAGLDVYMFGCDEKDGEAELACEQPHPCIIGPAGLRRAVGDGIKDRELATSTAKALLSALKRDWAQLGSQAVKSLTIFCLFPPGDPRRTPAKIKYDSDDKLCGGVELPTIDVDGTKVEVGGSKEHLVDAARLFFSEGWKVWLEDDDCQIEFHFRG